MIDNEKRRLIKIRLNEAIQNSGYKYSVIAKKIGIDKSMLTQYFSTNKLPSITTLSKICEVIGADANYILGLVDN
ncbi:MAG TPA: helix-turn-helix transcriptional regulator [Candidatus Onthoplasma faecigallinarum]|nr:helix-turn-helix transcriptional regulator [Candidatus Onthoplasma faecigallinarum]